MYQNNYNGFQPQQKFFSNMLKGRPVSSLEEAKAAPIDFDGSMYFFPDVANQMIYTKQINLDGTASLNAYKFIGIPKEESKDFVTRTEFEQTLTEIKEMLNRERELVQKGPQTGTAQF